MFYFVVCGLWRDAESLQTPTFFVSIKHPNEKNGDIPQIHMFVT